VAVLLSDEVVVLRPLTSDDVDEWHAGNDAAAPRDDVERAIVDWAESWRTGGPVRHWAICEQETGAIVGGVELRDVGASDVDLSYGVFKAWRRRGIATRACRLALAYAAGVMDRRNALFKVRQGNRASLAVARKLGATVTGMEMTEDGSISVVLRLALEPTR
jgi:RimJ/RimL family protein N-acetyltransferase